MTLGWMAPPHLLAPRQKQTKAHDHEAFAFFTTMPTVSPAGEEGHVGVLPL
jgi:hypothetical protein